jgi:hypothetical protein
VTPSAQKREFVAVSISLLFNPTLTMTVQWQIPRYRDATSAVAQSGPHFEALWLDSGYTHLII